MKTIALYNLKGGVGKTAAAVNLAFLAADYGHRTLLWDLDPQGAATWCLNVDPGLKGGAKKLVKGKHPIGEYVRPSPYERLDVLPADPSNRHLDVILDPERFSGARLAELIEPFSESYSLVILDCPPSLSRLSENIFHAADILVVPLIPTPLSLRAYEQILLQLGAMKGKGKKTRVHPFLNLVDRRRRLHRELLEQLPATLKSQLKSYVPYASLVEQMCVQQRPLPCLHPGADASRSYEALWRELDDLLRQAG